MLALKLKQIVADSKDLPIIIIDVKNLAAITLCQL
jgi:hypothetical protein